MRLLLDTHYAFWLALRRDLLSAAELELLGGGNCDLFVSAVSIWELKLKWERRFTSGERKGPANPADVLGSLRAMGIALIELDGDLAVAELASPAPHDDPFDHLLLTIAQERGLRLLTRDRELARHPLAFAVG